MNIIINADRHVLSGVELLVSSLLMNTHGVNIYVLSIPKLEIYDESGVKVRSFEGLTREDEAWLKYLVHFLDCTSRINIIDCTDAFDTIRSSPNNVGSFGPYAALRLLSDLVVPESTALYLDSDIIVTEDLSDMYNHYAKMNIEYAAYCVRCDGEYRNELVSAVMFFNLDRIRYTGLLSRARINYNRNEYKFPDQKALEDAGKPYRMPETYNYMRKLHLADYEPAIVHFSNELSPKIYFGIGDFYSTYPQYRQYNELIKLVHEIYMK